MARQQTSYRSSNARVAAVCAGVVVAMAGMAYAAVPLYQIFCQVTGFGGVVQRADRAPQVTSERTITVRFDANSQRRLNWEFAPLDPIQTVQIGAVQLAHYRAINLSDHPQTGVAAFNVMPAEAAIYFNKMACFCFEEQTLAAGEAVEMPVQFFIDPEILTDPQASRIKEITLSYSFALAPTDPETVASVNAPEAGPTEEQTL